MIPDYNRYYGCVFTQLVENRSSITLQKLDVGIQGFYLIAGSIPLYIKYSRRRKGPWSFNFHADHQICCDELCKKFGGCLIAFVCGSDGVLALDNIQMREVLDDKFGEQEAISVRRKLGHMYSVSGKDGKLDRKVARDSLALLVEKYISAQEPRSANSLSASSPTLKFEETREV